MTAPRATRRHRAPGPMGLWRLEWLRLVRTRRLAAVVGVFAFFGLTAAPMTRYAGELVGRLGGSVQIIAPPPVPADAMTSYVSNASQLGLLAFVLVAASALTVDAQRESAVFLRTRATRRADLVVPRLVTSAAVGAAAYVAGALLTWYGTAILLGDLPVGPTALGIALSALYLPFLATVAAVVAQGSRSVALTALVTLGVAVASGVVGAVLPASAGRWLPSHLVGSLPALAAGGSVGDALPAAVVAVVLGGALAAAAVRLAGRHEL